MTNHRVLVSDPISEIGIQALQASDQLDVDVKTGLSPEELIDIIGDYHGLVIRSQTKVTPEVFAAAKNLKVVGRAGIGVDNVDRQAATDHGVIVMNTPTGNTITTAEHAFTLMLATARNIGPAHSEVLKGNFAAARKAFQGIELNQKRLAIVGMGRIGAEFAKRAQGFQMKVVAYDPFLTQARADEMKIERADSALEALTGADVVTVHVPLIEQTRHMINAETLAVMNPGALVINCARGGVVDESALLEAIKSGHIAGCGLDVFEEEPPSADNPLFSLEKHLTCTPHLGASTHEAQENVGIQVAEQIRDFLVTGEIRNALNMPSLNADALAEIQPYINLATSLGKLVANLGPESPDALRVSYHGPLADKDTSLISRTALTALLQSSREEGEVNIVNAPAIAEQMGLDLTESTIHAKSEYNELLIVELRRGDTRFRAVGTVLGSSPRIVEIDRLFVDTNITGYFLIYRNDDRPGILGAVTSALGKAEQNIANLSLARNKSEDNALTVIELDSTLSPQLLDEIRSVAGVTSAFGITL